MRVSSPLNPETLTRLFDSPGEQPRQPVSGPGRLLEPAAAACRCSAATCARATLNRRLALLSRALCRRGPEHQSTTPRTRAGRRARPSSRSARRPTGQTQAFPIYNHSHEHGRLCFARPNTPKEESIATDRHGCHGTRRAHRRASAFAATGGSTPTQRASVLAEQGGLRRRPRRRWASPRSTSPTAPTATAPAPLTDIKTTIYGLKSDGKDFPTCSMAKITTAGNDTVCPKGALVATGAITAILGRRRSDLQRAGPAAVRPAPRRLERRAGQARVLLRRPGHHPHVPRRRDQDRAASGRIPATYQAVGKNLVMDTPIPNVRVVPAHRGRGLAHERDAELEEPEHEAQERQDRALRASVACKGGKRPYSVTFTAESGPGGAPQSETVTGTQKCS